ncbi:MAG: single-stranded DNA-binding protein [Bacteroidales bacterium]|nr:single-stranded DNA-binding protein [Bacteroidales bacterium]
MAALNKVLLIGNVGRDPEIRDLESGAAVATFTLATTEVFRDQNGGTREQTEWHNIVAWRRLAELSRNYIRKGSQIYVEGRLRSRSWDGQDGQKRYITEIVADVIQLLGRRDGQGGQPGQGMPSDTYSAAPTYQSAGRPATPAPAAQVPPQATPAPAPAAAQPMPGNNSEEIDDLPF